MPNKNYSVGNLPPQVLWTIVRGDSAVFRVLVTDDDRTPLNIPDWDIKIEICRATKIILTLTPESEQDDDPGYFSVKLTPFQSELLETDDVFDIQLWNKVPGDEAIVWTVAQGSINMVEDITGRPDGIEE
jgi:hypothetical protein